jgi:hypothetical protein
MDVGTAKAMVRTTKAKPKVKAVIVVRRKTMQAISQMFNLKYQTYDQLP